MAKKDRLGLVKSCWERSEIYRFNRSSTQNFLRKPSTAADIFEEFEPPPKNFLAMPLSLSNSLTSSIAEAFHFPFLSCLVIIGG